MDSPPLDGLTVADFSRVLAGPLATMILGDLGADVVKVERPEVGDDTRSWGPPYSASGESSYYLSVNRNKKSVVLDLRTKQGRMKARDLALRADVLLENFKPGAMESFELGYEELAVDNPGLIYARITGFGSDAGADLPGYDYLVQAMSGLMSITGEPDGPPTKVGVAVVDVLTGLFTATGVLAALFERQRSRRGQFLEVSLLGSALAGLVNQASSYLTADVVPKRMGAFHPSIAPYEPFDTATEPMVVAVGNNRQFERLCNSLALSHLMEHEGWRTNEARVHNRHELHDILQQVLAADSQETWVGRLREAGIPCGPINDIREAFQLAHDLGLNPVARLGRDDGEEVSTTANPIHLSRTPVGYRKAPPHLGEDQGLI
jgi:crotonobetainyl-CoA:carnitine CoA-transferase CaiB-like acyl-CoA transferase